MAIRFEAEKPAREKAPAEPAVADAEPPEPTDRDATPAGPEPGADGLLPGLAEAARPRKRRRGRMMGFG